MKRVKSVKIMAMVLASALVATPAFAQQPLHDAVERAAASTATPDARRPATFWAGTAFATAGATLAILGTTAFKSEDGSSGNTPIGSFQACQALKANPVYAGNRCDGLKGPNRPLVWSGIAAAAAGVVLMTVGSPHSAIQFGPGSIRLERRVQF